MSLHRLTTIELAVPHIDEVLAFYRQFGLHELAPGRFHTASGGEQLRLVEGEASRVLTIGIGADEEADLRQSAQRLGAAGMATRFEGDVLVAMEPAMDIAIRVAIADRVTAPEPTERRAVDRAELVSRADVTPIRLGHIVLGCPDVEAASEFFMAGLGMRLSDFVAGGAFMRFATDHHNVCLLPGERPFLHHTAWKVASVDEVGYGAAAMIAVDAERDGWGLGRHAASANYFWYLADPAGSFAEYYYSELDDLAPDALFWDRDPDAAPMPLAAWGPDVPAGFLRPPAAQQPIPVEGHTTLAGGARSR